MAWVRKLVRQGGTHLVTLPLRCIEAMGVRAGDHLVVEQPFSGALIVRPVREDGARRKGDDVRSLGWAVERVNVEEIVRRFPMVPFLDGGKCTCCRQVVGYHQLVGGILCDFCMAELGNVIRLRMEPSQVEMSMR